VDDWFYKKFGIRARSNTVFVTKSFNVASEYGDPFLIFPVGKYTILSSSKIKDLFETLESLFKKFNGKNLSYFDDLDFDDQQKFKSFVIEKLESYNFVKGLQKHNNEQMINCKEYYLVTDKYRIIIANKIKVK
jgi:hypothetical protein